MLPNQSFYVYIELRYPTLILPILPITIYHVTLANKALGEISRHQSITAFPSPTYQLLSKISRFKGHVLHTYYIQGGDYISVQFFHVSLGEIVNNAIHS